MSLDLKAARTFLAQRFVQSEGVYQVLANGVVVRPNERPGHTLLYGPPGYGKSEMSKAFFEALGLLDKTFQLSFGEDSDEAKLLGGIDLKKFDEEKLIEYLVSNSFMDFEYVIFEEFFDAPPVVLTCLKDILSSGFLRKGRQRVKLKTKFIVACTNLDPREFGNGDDSRSALVQRFPLASRVCWSQHTAADYLKLYKLCYPSSPELHEVMANINAGINQLREMKYLINPRVARDGIEAIIRQARVFGREFPMCSDFEILSSVLGYDLAADVRRSVVQKNLKLFGGHILFGECDGKVRALQKRAAAPEIGVEEIAKIHAELETVLRDVQNLQVPPSLFEKRLELIRKIRGELGLRKEGP